MDYNIVRVKKENLLMYAALLSEVFPETKKYTPQFLNWQYFENPSGEVIGYDAFYQGKLVAHYVAIPVVYIYNEFPLKGVLSLNTATTKQHQGKGLFIKLASQTYQLAANEEYKFIIGVANQNSTHGFVNKLGFKFISELEVRLFIGKVKPKIADIIFKASRDQNTVKWRLQNPTVNYFKKGAAAFAPTHIRGINTFLTQQPYLKEFPLKKNISTPIKLVIGLNLKVYGLSIFIPKQFRPSPLNLIFKNLGGANINVNAKNCYFEAIDFDAY
jgi:hypothetical protein